MKKEYLRRLMIIAIPIMLSNIISQVQMLIDRIFLGRLDPIYMSAIGNISSPVWTTFSVCFTLITGASILISQGVGSGNRDNIESYAAAMFKWNNVLPILLFLFWMFFPRPIFEAMGVSENVMPHCLGYIKYYAPIFIIAGLEASTSVIMQTSNYTKPLVFYGVIRAVANIILDWILIFGHFGFPAMGIEGAALATTIAEYAGFIMALGYLRSPKLFTKPSLKAIIKAPLKPFLESARLGVNTALEDFTWNIGNLLIIVILNTIDEMAAGIYSIIFGIEVIVVVVVGAVGSGTMTLTGEATGKGDVAQYKGITYLAYTISIAAAAVLLIASFLIPDKIIGLFTTEATIIDTCGIYLILMCINLFQRIVNIVMGNAIRGSGDTAWMFKTQIFGTIFVVCGAAFFVFVCHLGIMGVFIAVLLDEAVRALINYLRFHHIYRHWTTIS